MPTNCPSCGAPITAADNICPFCAEVVGPYVPPAGTPDSEWAGPDAPSASERSPVSEADAASEAATLAAGAPPGRRSQEEIAAAGTKPLPWETWREYGFWNALWLTWVESVFRPVEFFRRMPPRGGIGPPLGFTVLFTALALLFSHYWGVLQGVLTGAAEGGPLAYALGGLLMGIVWLVLMLPVYVGLLFAMVAILHVSFIIVGAGRRGFEATFRGIAYASGPAAFAVFPFFGPLLSLVWGTVVVYVGVREAQRTTNGRAALAFLLPLIVFILLIVLLSIVLALVLAGADLTAPA